MSIAIDITAPVPVAPLTGKGSRSARIRARFHALDEAGRRCLDRNMRAGASFGEALRIATEDARWRQGAAS